jgi:hypothetical protein
MAESSWPTSEVMQVHLQNLMSRGYMTAAELDTCRVSDDHSSPALTGGYVVACTVFYEQGFSVITSISPLTIVVLRLGS